LFSHASDIPGKPPSHLVFGPAAACTLEPDASDEPAQDSAGDDAMKVSPSDTSPSTRSRQTHLQTVVEEGTTMDSMERRGETTSSARPEGGISGTRNYQLEDAVETEQSLQSMRQTDTMGNDRRSSHASVASAFMAANDDQWSIDADDDEFGTIG